MQLTLCIDCEEEREGQAAVPGSEGGHQGAPQEGEGVSHVVYDLVYTHHVTQSVHIRRGCLAG